MPVSQGIDDFITNLRPNPVCGICIAEGIGMTDASVQSVEITSALGTSGDFIQARGRCSLCGKDTDVIRRY